MSLCVWRDYVCVFCVYGCSVCVCVCTVLAMDMWVVCVFTWVVGVSITCLYYIYEFSIYILVCASEYLFSENIQFLHWYQYYFLCNVISPSLSTSLPLSLSLPLYLSHYICLLNLLYLEFHMKMLCNNYEYSFPMLIYHFIIYHLLLNL